MCHYHVLLNYLLYGFFPTMDDVSPRGVDAELLMRCCSPPRHRSNRLNYIYSTDYGSLCWLTVATDSYVDMCQRRRNS